MKKIQPVSIWYNGLMVTATIFNMNSINDNLTNTAIFYWQLFDNDTIEKTQLVEGNLTMTGADYTTYSSSQDSNSYAYEWGATQLNLTLV